MNAARGDEALTRTEPSLGNLQLQNVAAREEEFYYCTTDVFANADREAVSRNLGPVRLAGYTAANSACQIKRCVGYFQGTVS